MLITFDETADAHNAAERKWEAMWRETQAQFNKMEVLAQELDKQLTDERKKVQTYEGAMIKIANDPNCDRCQVAVDALAKVGKL